MQMKKVNVRGAGIVKLASHLKVRKIGNACYICLPKPFCALNNIEAGDPVAVAATKNVLTAVFPPGAEREE
jgi:hypothetical protein